MKPEPEIASADELLARYPDEYVLYEVLEYTRDAQVPRARLLGHGRDEQALLRKKNAYRRAHPKAIVGFHLSNLHRSHETILIL
jgi:hypothetical protein